MTLIGHNADQMIRRLKTVEQLIVQGKTVGAGSLNSSQGISPFPKDTEALD